MPVKNRVELKQYIRFQLSQMSARNEQHLWESAAFELARQRISPNLIPATGPVQAGGDQGRDFESYRAYLSDRLGARGWVGRGGRENLVFACTLQKTLKAKIKADLRTIFGGGQQPDAVYYFAEPDLAVAHRHELQAHCKEAYGARLEILDGQAVADMLSDPDTFWIAEQFFSVPAEMFPALPSDEEYDLLRARWLGEDRTACSAADFIELKRGLRATYPEDDHKVDLGGWMERMADVAKDAERPFDRKALYEILVAQFRGRGSLDPQAETVERFFGTLPTDPRADELEDAAVAVSYCSSARKFDQFSVSAETIKDWRSKVEAAIEAALAQTRTSGERYVLLLARAQTTMLGREGTSADATLNEVFADWCAALDIAEENPFCDVGHFATMLELLVPAVGTHRRFGPFADRVDAMVAKREGDAAAAERSRSRALAHFEAEQLLLAIDQLQRAKEGWFAAETLTGSILAMLLLSEAYRELNLPWAARFYASAAQYVAAHSGDEKHKRYIARAAFEIADSFFAAGEALSYLTSLRAAFTLHAEFEVDPGDMRAHTHFADALAQAAKLRAFFKRLTPSLLPAADTIMKTWPLDKAYGDLILKHSEEPPWSEYSVDDLNALLREQVGQSLHNDVGTEASLRWRALGVRWTIRSTSADRLLAEQLAATLQIVQADLAEVDLLIVPSDVDIALSFGAGAYPRIRREPGNDGTGWEVALPQTFEGDAQEQIRLTLTVVMMVLGQASALSSTEFRQQVDARMARGLMKRAFWVRPAKELLGEARQLATPKLDLAALSPPASESIEPLEAKALAWRDSPAQSYSREAAEEFLRNRYRRMTPLTKAYAPLLMADPEIGPVLRSLRDQGLLDWQIMSVLFNIVLQESAARVAPEGAVPGREMIEPFREAIKAIEGGVIPGFDRSLFTVDVISAQTKVQTVTAMSTWGLAVNSQTPDLDAIKRLLDVRFQQAIDDIEHEDVFGWASQTA